MTIRKILWYLCALCLTIGSLILGGVIALFITVVGSVPSIGVKARHPF